MTRSDTIQNEVVELFAQEFQKLIIGDMEFCEYFGIVADSTTDVSGDEQFACTLHAVLEQLETHEPELVQLAR